VAAQQSEKVVEIKIRDLPSSFEDYISWRYSLKAAILAASENTDETLRYLREMGDLAIGFVQLDATLTVQLRRLDARVFSAILTSAKSKEALRIIEKVQLECPFGSGRVAVRIIDVQLHYEKEKVSIRATSLMMAIKCKDASCVERYLQEFRLLRAQMAAAPANALTNNIGIEILRRGLQHIETMKPLLAIDVASFNMDLEILYNNIERYVNDERARRLTAGGGGHQAGAFGAFGAGGAGGKGGFTGACYNYGGAGHMAKDCPQGPKGLGKGKDKGKGKEKGQGGAAAAAAA